MLISSGYFLVLTIAIKKEMWKFSKYLYVPRSHQSPDHPVISQITNPVDFAEEPTWDGRKNILYFVDMHNGSIYAYHYNTNEVTRIQLEGDVTPVVPSKNDPNLFYVGLGRSVVALEWDGFNNTPSKQRVLTTISEDFPNSRFNDGKADKEGRLWWGKK